MTATTRFYVIFGLALAAIVVISFFVGYRAGIEHERRLIHRTVPLPATHALGKKP